MEKETEQTRLSEFDERIVIFNGGTERWKGWDQYVDRCEGGGKHLHIYKLGGYKECSDCRHQKVCSNTAYVAGEQSEL